MKLGILVNTDRHLDAIAGLTHAARAQGHEVVIFAMDEGTRLLADPACVALCGLPGVTMSFCHESATREAVALERLPAALAGASQLQNAMMVHGADRVIVL